MSCARAHLAAVGCNGQEIARAHLAAIGCNGLTIWLPTVTSFRKSVWYGLALFLEVKCADVI